MQFKKKKKSSSENISTHFVAHAHAVLKTVHTLFLEGYLMNLSLKTFQRFYYHLDRWKFMLMDKVVVCT